MRTIEDPKSMMLAFLEKVMTGPEEADRICKEYDIDPETLQGFAVALADSGLENLAENGQVSGHDIGVISLAAMLAGMTLREILAEVPE